MTTDPKARGVVHATVRDGDDDWHIECRFADGQKFAAVTVDREHEELAHFIAAALAQPRPEQVEDEAVRAALRVLVERAHEFGTFYVDGDDDHLAAWDRIVVPALVAARAALARPAPKPAVDVGEALRFYANPDNWIDTPSWDGDPSCLTPKAIPVDRSQDGSPCDCGDIARKALLALAASPAPANAAPASEREGA
jgi:hypothetical protein